MLVTTLWATLFACGTPLPGAYSGLVGSLPTQLAIVTNATGGQAYVCGADATMDHHHTWMDLKIDGLKLHGEAEKLTIDAKWEGDRWRGSMIDVDSTGQVFVLFESTQDDGLYEAADPTSECRVGAIVSDDAAALQGVYCFPDQTFAQVVPVGETLTIADGGFDAQTATDPPVALSFTRVEP